MDGANGQSGGLQGVRSAEGAQSSKIADVLHGDFTTHPQSVRLGTRPLSGHGMKRQMIASTADIDTLEQLVIAAAEATMARLGRLANGPAALEALARLKFAHAGCDPLDQARALNFVEQINQTFTYLASFEGARWLLREHPRSTPLVLNLGTTPGSDIESLDGLIAAETFAATEPDSNDKLRKDIAKVRATNAKHKYVFFLSPQSANGQMPEDVRVIPLCHEAVNRHFPRKEA